MAESLKKQQQHERMQPGYYDGCTKLDHEVDQVIETFVDRAPKGTWSGGQQLRTHHHPDFDDLEERLRDPQSVSRFSREPGVQPQIKEFADWCKTVSQGSGRIVSLAQ